MHSTILAAGKLIDDLLCTRPTHLDLLFGSCGPYSSPWPKQPNYPRSSKRRHQHCCRETHFPEPPWRRGAGHSHLGTHAAMQSGSGSSQVALHADPHGFHTCPPLHVTRRPGADAGGEGGGAGTTSDPTSPVGGAQPPHSSGYSTTATLVHASGSVYPISRSSQLMRWPHV